MRVRRWQMQGLLSLLLPLCVQRHVWSNNFGSKCCCPSAWKRTHRDTTLLDHVCVPCALICMLDAAVSILVQAMALCCSRRLWSVYAWLMSDIPEHAVLPHMERKARHEHTPEDSMRTNRGTAWVHETCPCCPAYGPRNTGLHLGPDFGPQFGHNAMGTHSAFPSCRAHFVVQYLGP